MFGKFLFVAITLALLSLTGCGNNEEREQARAQERIEHFNTYQEALREFRTRALALRIHTDEAARFIQDVWSDATLENITPQTARYIIALPNGDWNDFYFEAASLIELIEFVEIENADHYFLNFDEIQIRLETAAFMRSIDIMDESTGLFASFNLDDLPEFIADKKDEIINRSTTQEMLTTARQNAQEAIHDLLRIILNEEIYTITFRTR